MIRNDLLRAMIRALADVTEQSDTYEMSTQWDVTLHAGRRGSSLTIPHVVKLSLKPEFLVVETSKGHRYVLVDEEVNAIAQEPSERESKNRRAGFL